MKYAGLLLIAALLLGCAQPEKDVTLTILTEHYPPLSYMENGIVTGYGADVVSALQAELKSYAVVQLMNWDEAYARALKEPNVLLFTIEKTPERANLFHFIGPLGDNTASLYARKSSDLALQDIEAAKQVPAIATTTEWFTEQYLKKQGFANLVSRPDPKETLKLVLDKNADLGVFTDITIPEIAKSAGVSADTLKPVLQLMKTQYYIAISKKTDKRTVARWQEAFAKLEREGRIQSIRELWFPAD